MEKLGEFGVAVIVSIVFAIGYAVIFSLEYPLFRTIDAALASLFAIAGLFTYILIRAAIRLFRK